MKSSVGLRVLLGVLAGLGLGAAGVLLLPPLVVPGGQSIEEKASDLPRSEEAVVALPPGAGAPAPEPPGPGFDTVRVEPDGSGLVAGRAQPGASVAILADEEVVAEAEADTDGRFVAFLSLAPSEAPRMLSLRDGAGRVSDETVILAPLAGPAIADAGAGKAAVAALALDGGAQEVTSSAPERSGNAENAASVPSVAAASPDSDSPNADPGRAVEAGTAVAVAAGPMALPANSAPGSVEAASAAAQAGPALLPGVAQGAPNPMDRLDERGPALALAGGERSATPGAGTPREAPVAGSFTVPDQGSVAPTASIADLGGSALDADSGPDGRAAAVATTDPTTARGPDAALETGAGPEVAVAAPALPAFGAPAQPGQAPVLVSDADGVRVLQPALPPGADADVLSSVALDAITYGGTGEVVLSGRGSGGMVRLYLDNRPVGDATIGEDGRWSAEIAGAQAGVYTLRLDQLDAEGEVVSRIETPFLREERSSLAAAMAEAQEAGQTIAMRTVQPGNTLWAIARDRYGEPLMYVQVFEANRDRIRDPDLIYPGQVFVLPATEGR